MESNGGTKMETNGVLSNRVLHNLSASSEVDSRVTCGSLLPCESQVKNHQQHKSLHMPCFTNPLPYIVYTLIICHPLCSKILSCGAIRSRMEKTTEGNVTKHWSEGKSLEHFHQGRSLLKWFLLKFPCEQQFKANTSTRTSGL